MALIKFDPLREFENMQNRIQRYFNDFNDIGFDLNSSYFPTLDVSEDDKNLIIEVEVPGVNKKDIKLTLNDNILTIEGEKKKSESVKHKGIFRKERIFGSFKRSFTLPVEVDENNIEAKFEDGMLNIKIQKSDNKKSASKIIKVN